MTTEQNAIDWDEQFRSECDLIRAQASVTHDIAQAVADAKVNPLGILTQMLALQQQTLSMLAGIRMELIEARRHRGTESDD